MAETGVADALRKLATGSANRTDTARLRDIFGEVETALAAGVTHAAILDTLHSNGFTLTLKSFQSALYRIRKEKPKASATAAPPAVQAATPPPGRPPGPAPAPSPPKKRGPLDPPAAPRKFEWDPLARPVLEFVDPPADEAKTKSEE